MLLKRTISLIILLLISILSFSFLPSYPVFADDTTYNSICENENIPREVKKASGCSEAENGTLPYAVIIIIDGVIAVAGVIAVIYVLIGGYNYMTSTGDSSKVEKAKKTILYAVIGLAICVLAFAIVNFTIRNVINVPETSPSLPEPTSEAV